MVDPANQATTSEINAAKSALKIPPFWTDEPELWFLHLEVQFESSNITLDKTKYTTLLQHLNLEQFKCIKDLLISPPATNAYQEIKSELIKRLSVSQGLKTKQLLEHEEIGDRTPSQFLRHMKDLAGSEVPDSLLSTLWKNRLPNSMQSILAAASVDKNLDELAKLADAIHEQTSTQPHTIAAVHGETTTIQELRDEIRNLKLQLNRRSRSSSRHRRSNSNRRNPSQHRTCWYHRRFGSLAKKCIQPCSNYQETKNQEESH